MTFTDTAGALCVCMLCAHTALYTGLRVIAHMYVCMCVECVYCWVDTVLWHRVSKGSAPLPMRWNLHVDLIHSLTPCYQFGREAQWHQYNGMLSSSPKMYFEWTYITFLCVLLADVVITATCPLRVYPLSLPQGFA